MHLKVDSGWFDEGKFTGAHRTADKELRYLEFDEETIMAQRDKEDKP